MTISRNRICALLAALALSTVAWSAPPRYAVIPLGEFAPAGLNAAGQAVGHYFTSDHRLRALVTRPHRPFNSRTDDIGDLGLNPPFAGTRGTAINVAGQATGFSSPLGQVGFLWTPGGTDGVPTNPEMRPIGSLLCPGVCGYSNGLAINAAGQIAGRSRGSGAEDRAILWTPGATDGVAANPEMKDLGALTPSAAFSLGAGVNAAGQVVGTSYLSLSPVVFHAFLWTAGGTDGVPTNPQMKDLGTLGGASSTATAVNALGQVIGDSNTTSGFHSFLWTPGGTDGVLSNPQMKDLAPFGALAINDAGEMVGDGVDPTSGELHAFVYQDGVPIDLNDLVSNPPDEYLYQAIAITEDGEILCRNHTLRRPQFAAVLLKPLH